MEQVLVRSREDMHGCAERVLRSLSAVKSNGATVLALTGELGSGKTTFTQMLASLLGVTLTVTSPTFVVLKRYPLTHARFDTLVHVDLYRIEHESELAPLRLTEELHNPKNLVVIEWPERAPATIPTTAVPLSFVVTRDGTRTVTYGT